MEDVILTQKGLETLLEVWQERLRLQDWEIEVQIKPASELREDTMGGVNWTLETKQAFIAIMDPKEYPDDLMSNYDMESVLVHELVHIHLAPIHQYYGCNAKGNVKGFYTLFEEQAIESITHGLLYPYRAETALTKTIATLASYGVEEPPVEDMLARSTLLAGGGIPDDVMITGGGK